MRISDAGNGITPQSLEFYREHRHRLAEVREVAVRFPGYSDPHDPYLLTLTDVNGDEMRMSGCTTGYIGDATHATMRVLIEEGCPVGQAIVVISAATATFVRRDSGWEVDDYTLAYMPLGPAADDLAPKSPPARTLNGSRR